MAAILQPWLFNWKEIEAASELDRLILVLSVLPDEKLAEHDGRRDTDADWGVKTYKGTRKDGTAWEKVTKWFGYKLHLLVDSVYELPLVEDLEENHPRIHDDVDECSADKGYDSAENNAALYDEHDIKPVIDTRKLWKNKVYETLYPERYDVFCYFESGRVYCSCPSERRGEDELRELAFVGFEKDRGTLKYRCPAAAFGSDKTIKCDLSLRPLNEPPDRRR